MGTTYHFPPNEKVSLTFTQLPEGSGTVTVREIKLTEEQVKETGALSDTAYEITSTMVDGTFEYTLTLPTPTTQNVEVKASEDGGEFTPVDGESVGGDVITITGLTHFTIFVVVGTIDINDEGVLFAVPFDESGSNVLINEFVYRGSPEWIELYNRGSESVDLTNWRLEDGNSDPDDDLTLSGTILAGGLLVFQRGSGWLNDTSNNNNTGDTISLKNPDGEIVSQVRYIRTGSNVVDAQNLGVSNLGSGQSIARSEDGGSTWQVPDDPTKGFNNDANDTGEITFLNVGSIYPFSSIFEGLNGNGDLNGISAGGTINVAEGEYQETLVIDRSLTLRGAGRGTSTILDSDCFGDPTVSIDADDVTIQGFTIDNDGCEGSVVWVANGITGVVIRGNELINGNFGVEANGVSDANLTITDNTITNNDSTGIYLSGGGSTVSNSTVTISGNTISSNSGDGIYADVITDSTFNLTDNTIENNSGNGIYICAIGQCESSNVTISGNSINNNSESGIYLSEILDGSQVTISENTVSGNGQDNDNGGVYISQVTNSTVDILDNDILENFGRGIYVNDISGSTFTIGEGNNISSNTDTGIYVNYIGGAPPEPSSLTISDNTISSNEGRGIYIWSVDEISGVTIGSGNTISSNGLTGIYLDFQATGVEITGNTTTDNGLEGTTGIVVNQANGNEAHNNIISGNIVGVQNNDEDGDNFDARENYWGSILGPFHELLNPEGEGNSVSDNVWFRPFFLDELLSILSTNEVSPDDLASLLDSGSFSIPEGEDSSGASQVNVNEDLTINVPDSGGTSTVTLPAGTEITRTGGAPIDVGALTADDVTESSLTGLASGEVVDGALQWGLDDVELEFSQPITLSIFVGTSFNGQTLNVLRSTSGDGGWTSDGIVAPATCVVAGGLCTFTATKASFYATTHTTTPAAPDGGGGGGGTSAAGAPTCGDAKPGSAPTLLSAVAGTNSVTLTWSKAAGPVTYYLINYSTTPGVFQYGNPNVGGPDTTSYTVQGLSGGTTYYFKVRAGNGCMPGDYSNEVAGTPGGGFISGPATGFIPGVLGEQKKVEVTPEDEGGVKDEEARPFEGLVTRETPTPSFFEALGKFLQNIFGFFTNLFSK